MHLFIIRHGECLGQCDPAYAADPDSPLSSRGEQQAQAVAHQLRTQRISHILSSPLRRSLATAHIVAEALDLDSVDVWLDMREGWNTPYRGARRAAMQKHFPRALLPPSITDAGWEHPGDTGYEHVLLRASTVLEQLKRAFAATDRIALVTHGGFANALLHVLLQIAPTTPHWFELANGSISHVRLVPEPKKERPNWPLYPPVHVEVLALNAVPWQGDMLSE